MVVVAEDDRDVREMLCEVLTAEGFDVAAARNGVETLALLRANTSRICVVLLDVMMPVMSGAEVIEHQRRDPQLSTVPVVVMSARWETRDLFEGIEFLRKPMSLDHVLHVVRHHCKQRPASATM